MTISASTGTAVGLDGAQVGQSAARESLSRLDRATPAAALVFASDAFPTAAVLSGVSAALGSTPVWGFSTTRPRLLPQGEAEAGQRVVVTLLAGEDLRAAVHHHPGFSASPAACAAELSASLPEEPAAGHALLFAAGGMTTGTDEFCAALSDHPPLLAGALSCGESSAAGQLASPASGSDPAAWIRLSGRIRMGIGASHPWQPVGAYFHVTRATGPWISSLDHQLPNHAYSALFGSDPSAWCQPPLSSVSRLYPLGVETQPGSPRQLVLPLRFETDGRLRLNRTVHPGSVAHLLVGSPSGCLAAARQAAQQAVESLGSARPILALVFVDTAFEQLLEARPVEDLATIQQTLRSHYPDLELPIAAAYSLGQIFGSPPRAENGYITVILLGETAPT